jgi:predicted ATP-grasp superfamily ATP-dependent carboligase
MRIFLYEYTCACAGPDLPESLRHEGRAMLTAVGEDLGRLPGVRLVALWAAGQPPAAFPAEHVFCPVGAEELRFRQLAREADFTLVIAPESNGVLAQRCRWVLESGSRLLGASPQAAALAGDKLALAEHLRARGIPTPPVWLLSASASPPPCPLPAVCKPRDGAGAQATFLLSCWEELPACLKQAAAEIGPAAMLVQPFVPGQAASQAFLVGPKQLLPLPPAEQHLSREGRFRYQGGAVPLPAALAERAQRLATAAVRAVPGLCGYVGVDLVLGPEAAGREDWVIEINPRLTTSYLGLRRLCRSNLAAAWLQVVQGQPVPPLEWEESRVVFTAAGLRTAH